MAAPPPAAGTAGDGASPERGRGGDGRLLQGTAVAVAGAGGPAGQAVLLRLAAAGAVVAAAEVWTPALADDFRAAAAEEGGPPAAAAVLVVKALVHDAMRKRRPQARFEGCTDVRDLAESLVDAWRRPAGEVNGRCLWLTEQP